MTTAKRKGGRGDGDITLLTINSRGKGVSREHRLRLSFGQDTHYDMRIEIGPNTGDVDVATDGVFRPACAFVLGGLDHDETASEIRVYRCFGEDDLRWIANACLDAAGKMRRIENTRRKKVRSPRTAAGKGGGRG